MPSRSSTNSISGAVRAVSVVAFLGLSVLVGGCTPYSTYPPVSNAEVILPWMYPMPQVMASSLRTTYDKTAPALEAESGRPELVFVLPEGISQGVWRSVAVDSGVDGARAMNESDVEAGTPVWAVEQVRVRNDRAEVDVIFPTTNGYERATVILESKPFQPYRVSFFQRWRVPVDAPQLNLADDETENQEVVVEETSVEMTVSDEETAPSAE